MNSIEATEETQQVIYEPRVVRLPQNGSSDQSVYIGILAKFLDMWEFNYPITVEENGVKYPFDFDHAESGRFVKILAIEEDAARYTALPYAERILFLLDARGLHCNLCGECRTCCGIYTTAESYGGYILSDDGRTYCVSKQEHDGYWDPVEPSDT